MAHDHTPRVDDGSGKTRLIVVICITGSVLLAEVVGAAFSGSLALLADAGHMLSDLIGLIIALVATVVAARPATQRHTFGYRRVEVFAALLNGVLLLAIAVSITIAAIERLVVPTAVEVASGPLLVVAVIGLVANCVALLILRPASTHTINLRGAYLEVFGDFLGSVTAIVAGLVIWATGFMPADAIASLVIAAMIAPRALFLLRDVFRVLSESAPVDTNIAEIREHVLRAPGVVDVHDVHVWSITSGQPVFSAHVVVEAAVFERGDTGALLDRLDGCLAEHFDVAHSTFQLEPETHAAHEGHRHD
ncbi:cation diffusion facilitator family transporter [Klugiella xanthotipulae]|uniref:Cobalt-zinc-cadmium efflux system protein n=1 Tax=Klugiella xanthotipulae TaxID=244735 RepID=A0A543I483_9MICO|nr:cation diffusion facilitator family transporter [Klugiella xanthotipulae]TQM65404.1 cobalt-zinc-cadmium efflux system protein [Klugiella xanthotipulae]